MIENWFSTETCVVGAQKNHRKERFISGTKIICYDHDYNCIMTVLYYGQVAFITKYFYVLYCIVYDIANLFFHLLFRKIMSCPNFEFFEDNTFENLTSLQSL